MEDYSHLPPRIALFKKAYQKWGEQSQLRMVQEECAELIVAINKYDRYGNDIELERLIEEMADVAIMHEQLKYILEQTIGPSFIEQYQEMMQNKLNRLESYLN